MTDIPRIKFYKQDKIDLEFEIFTLSDLLSRKLPPDHSPNLPHRIEFHMVIYITKGRGVHFIDFLPFKYQSGSLLFISKGQVHAFDPATQSDGFLILFTEAFLSKNLIHSDLLSLHRLYNYHLHAPVLYSNEIGNYDFKRIFQEINIEYNLQDDYVKEEILCHLLRLLLLKAERIKSTLGSSKGKTAWITKFTEFKNMLEAHYSESRNALDYADMMNTSYKHLNMICKSITGKTAKNFIDHFITLEIKRQLATTDIPVKELTYKMGFDEPTNLVKFFRKHTSQTPSQFKEFLFK